MRGCQEPQVPMLTFVDMYGRVPPDHPLRTIKALADEALRELSSEFDRMYAEVGRPSIPPERLLKASLLIALFSVRSERAFCEELDYNMLYRWFLDMNLLESSFDPTVFTKNRQRLLEHAVGQQLFATVLVGADRHGLLSDEHFTVDGTLIEAAASLKSFKSKWGEPASDDGDPGNPSVDFHGEKRRNKTHQSTTDQEARLFRKGKGKEAKGVHGPRPDGEPERAADGLPGERGERDGGARCGPEAPGGGEGAGLPPQDPGWGQELRHAGLCGSDAQPKGHASRGPEHQWPAQRHRRADNPASGLPGEPANTKAGGGDLRVDEDGRWVSEDQVSRGGQDGTSRLPGGHCV